MGAPDSSGTDPPAGEGAVEAGDGNRTRVANLRFSYRCLSAGWETPGKGLSGSQEKHIYQVFRYGSRTVAVLHRYGYGSLALAVRTSPAWKCADYQLAIER